MLAPEPVLSENRFSKEAIRRQLHKIVSDPIFEGSEILKKFLLYIVGETLEEHANRLKEYTIAVNALKRPSDFNPQESGIVRIHAGRLRRALNYYYGESGILDPIRISIPKGSYVPVFGPNDDDLPSRMLSSRKAIVVGVVPFTCSEQNGLTRSFTHGLGVQLSKALMSLENFSVVAHYAMQHMATATPSAEQAASALGARYLIAGDIQVVKKHVRVHLQMIRMRTNQLVWSQMYERIFSASDMFSMQDDIIREVVAELGSLAF